MAQVPFPVSEIEKPDLPQRFFMFQIFERLSGRNRGTLHGCV